MVSIKQLCTRACGLACFVLLGLDHAAAQTSLYEGVYRPDYPFASDWACTEAFMGQDGGSVGVLDGYLEGVENRCKLTEAIPSANGLTTSFTAICSGEGSTSREQLTLTKTETGLDITRDGTSVRWRSCDLNSAPDSATGQTSNNRWVLGFGMGVSEAWTRDRQGNEVMFSCNNGVSGGLSVMFESAPTRGRVLTFNIDDNRFFSFPVSGGGGTVDTTCITCGDDYRALWDATAAGSLLTVTSNIGEVARFALSGSRDALGREACVAKGH